MKSSMIASVGKDAGRGCPPTTNINESINRINLQYCNTDCVPSTWSQLSDKLYSLVVSQQKEVEKLYMGWVNIGSRIVIGIWKLKLFIGLR